MTLEEFNVIASIYIVERTSQCGYFNRLAVKIIMSLHITEFSALVGRY